MNRAVAVPRVYRGLWRRRLLSEPGGVDRSSRVLWLQTAGLYVDLRIPSDRVRDDAASLARQQGFAGLLQVDGDVLAWDRWLDLHPPGPPDVGRMSFQGELMIEHGVHANYYEEWERVAPWCDDAHAALTLQDETDGQGQVRGCAGVLVLNGDHCAVAVDQLVEFAERDRKGRWHVAASNQPEREQREFEVLHGHFTRIAAEVVEQWTPAGTRRRWRILDAATGFDWTSGVPT